MRGLDAYLSDEPFEDAPLHSSCVVCFTGALLTYFEQVDGECRACRDLDELERKEREECEREEAA